MRLTAGFLRYRKTGETGWRDIGNIVEWSTENNFERASRMVSERGFKRMDKAWTKSVTLAYKFVTDEYTETLMELLNLGALGSNVSQSAATGQSYQIASSLKGRSYTVSKYAISNVVVEVSAAAKTEGTDYVVDLESGFITILSTGTIADGSVVDIDFDCAAVTMHRFGSVDAVKAEGEFMFDQKDQDSPYIRARHYWTGSIYVDNAGNHNLDNPAQVSLKVDCHNKPQINERG